MKKINIIEWIIIISTIFVMIIAIFCTLNSVQIPKKDEIWVVEFANPELADENAVFYTKAQAEKYLRKEFNRCSDIWGNVEIVAEGKTYLTIRFDVLDEPSDDRYVTMYKTKIQK